jgi:hypothetical protein
MLSVLHTCLLSEVFSNLEDMYARMLEIFSESHSKVYHIKIK